jgi:hypothetical protein
MKNVRASSVSPSLTASTNSAPLQMQGVKIRWKVTRSLARQGMLPYRGTAHSENKENQDSNLRSREAKRKQKPGAGD